MYAIVEIAGKQFKVNQNQKLFVNRLSEKEGSKVSFDKFIEFRMLFNKLTMIDFLLGSILFIVSKEVDNLAAICGFILSIFFIHFETISYPLPSLE